MKKASKPHPKDILAKYIPAKSLNTVYSWIVEFKVSLVINKSRSTKLGDYRSPYMGKGHRITVNHDLNQYSFLITLVHEIAHLTAWEKFKNRVPPHGKEWKKEFQVLLSPFLNNEVFPDDVLSALTSYIQNPAAASCTDSNLLRTLRRYDAPDSLQTIFHVEDLPEGAVFYLKNGMGFKKGVRLRKRFQCTEIKTKKTYLVNPLAEAMIPQKAAEAGQLKLL